METIWRAAAVVFLGLVGLVSNSQAGPLTGDNMSAYFAQPNDGTPYSGLCGYAATGCFSPDNFTVAAGIETYFIFCCGSNLAAIDFSDDSLTITWVASVGGNYATAFQGFVFTDATSAFDPILSVSGLNASWVTVSGNKLDVNLGPGQAWGFQPGDQIVVTFGSGTGNVPEPGTLALCAMALLAFAGIGRRGAGRLTLNG